MEVVTLEEIANVEKLANIRTFEVWNFQVTIILKASGLMGIVQGEEKYEDLTEDNAKKVWIRSDAKAQRVLISTVDKKVLLHIINCKTSAEMYTKLCMLYRKDSEIEKCSVMQEFFNFTYVKGCDMSLHISKLENLAYRLKTIKQDVSDEMLMSKILSSLPDRFKFFKTAWESTPKIDKTLVNLTARLIAEDETYNNKEGASVAFNVTEKICHKCYKKGHIAKFCISNSNSSESGRQDHTRDKGSVNNIKCFNCGKGGHLAKNCYLRENIGCKICKKTNHAENNCYFRDRKGENHAENKNKKLSFLSYSEKHENSSIIKPKNLFVVDSGCTSHMVNDKMLLREFEKKNVDICVAKKDIEIKAKGLGIIENEKCILNEVLYVPDLTKNLISVSAITENEGKVVFEKDRVYVTKNNEKVFEGKKNPTGLYEVDLDECNYPTVFLTEDKAKKAIDWHRKLGHLSVSNIKKLLENDMVKGMDLGIKDTEFLDMPCEICLKSKQVRFSFDSERTRARRPLEIVHTDLCGPIDPDTWDGKKYILTVLDDYTHFAVIYLLKHKNEVTEYIKEYVAEMEAYKGVKVSKLRCDNGREYVNNEMLTFCRQKGIRMDPTIPYSPQLNGKSERLNRTLLEKARSLIFDANLDKKFWGEATRVATYLLNRSPTSTLQNKTPYEMWTNRKPDLKNLQIFGSEAFAKTLGYLKKLDQRSEKYKMVGYAPNGYRLWDEKGQKIIIRRDVVFKEPENDLKEKSVGQMILKMENIEENQEPELIEPERDVQVHREPDIEEYIAKEDELSFNRKEAKETDEKITELKTSQKGNDIEYIYELSSSEDETEMLDLGQGNTRNTSRAGRSIRLPKKYNDYILLTYEEAINCNEKEQWKIAIKDEKDSLQKNHTWETVERQEALNKKILTNKWVFKKRDNGTYKARLVVRGCQQEKGIDFQDIFSPVINITSLRTLLALSVQWDYVIKKFDIKTAFLYGSLNEEVYMEIPQGYEKENNKICRLRKSLYGLKQAPVTWNEHFCSLLKEHGLKSISFDQCLFKNEKGTLFLAIYVDDGLIVGENEEEIDQLLEKLEENLEIKKSNEIDTFLGIRITRSKDSIKLDQEKYIEEVLERFGMSNAKPTEVPMIHDENAYDAQTGKINFPYREAVGSLLYISSKTRPDIAYAVGFCSRKMENPTGNDISNIKRIMRYLKYTKEDGIIYKKTDNKMEIKAFSDSDFAGEKTTRKSTTGYVVYYCDGPVSWCSRKQPVVALSSTEAEFIAAADCVKELLYLKVMIEHLTNTKMTVTLNIDNQSAIAIIKNGQFNKRSKHIDVRYHFIHEKIRENLIQVGYLCSEKMIADIFTKPLCKIKFLKHKNQLVY